MIFQHFQIRGKDCEGFITIHQSGKVARKSRAHAAGFRVLCYTVNDPQRAQQLFDWGIDSIITDMVDRIPFIPAQETPPPA